MFVRTPLIPAAFLMLVVAAVAMPGSAAGLLLLTPALAVLIPLLFSVYPGEKSVAKLVSWFARVRLPDTSRIPAQALASILAFSAGDGFGSANRGRGPPSLSLS